MRKIPIALWSIKMLKYIGSIWLTMALSSLLSITDYFFLGRINTSYYAITGIATIPFAVLSSLLVGFGIEVNRQVSTGKILNLAKIIGLALFVCGLLVVCFNALGENLFFFVDKEISIQEIRSYFSCLSLSAFPLVIIFIGAGLLRGQGKASYQIPFSILAVFLNFIFDFIFIEYVHTFSPLIGCAIATVIADSIVAFIYFSYFIYTRQLGLEQKLPTLFIKNTIWASLDKLFSVGSLLTVSQLFVSLMSLAEASLYFAFQVYLMPLVLWSHAYFEWVIHRRSNYLSYKDRFFSLTTIMIFILGTFFLTGWVHSEYQMNNFFAIGYCLYLILFWKEREYYGILFAGNRGKLGLAITALQKIIFITSLSMLLFSKQLHLLSFIASLVISMFLQNLFLEIKCKELLAAPLKKHLP